MYLNKNAWKCAGAVCQKLSQATRACRNYSLSNLARFIETQCIEMKKTWPQDAAEIFYNIDVIFLRSIESMAAELSDAHAYAVLWMESVLAGRGAKLFESTPVVRCYRCKICQSVGVASCRLYRYPVQCRPPPSSLKAFFCRRARPAARQG